MTLICRKEAGGFRILLKNCPRFLLKIDEEFKIHAVWYLNELLLELRWR